MPREIAFVILSVLPIVYRDEIETLVLVGV
jgi:hypothetical protein